MGDLFLKSYHGIRKQKWASLLVITATVLVLLVIGSKIQFESGVTSLIPANDDAKRIQKVLKSITFTDKIVVSIGKETNGSTKDLIEYATEFWDSITTHQSAFIKNVQGRVNEDDLPKTLDLVHKNLPLFLDSLDYGSIRSKLVKDSIYKITEKNYRTLISPSGIIAKRTLIKDPLGLSFMALKKLQQLGVNEEFKLKNGFLLDRDEENILLFITPVYGSDGTAENEPFSDALYALQTRLNEKYGQKVKSSYFGAALVAVANAKQIQHDIKITVSIAMTLLLLLLMLFYRRLTLPLILFAPTIFGVLLAVAFLCLLRTKISALSLGIGAILLGVTLDYALHILTHIRNGKSIESLYRQVAPSIMMSSLTTASAFLCLLFLESQALQDLGIFAAVSVMGSSCFALLFIPQVYKTVKKEHTRTILDRLASHKLHQNKVALALVGSIAVISIFTYGKVTFNQDITKLNYESEKLRDARIRLEKLTDISSKSIYLSTYGNNREKVLERNDAFFEKLQQLKKENKIISYSSISGLIKAQENQLHKIAAWKRFWEPDLVRNTTKNLIESGNDLGFKPTTFKGFYDLLDSDFKPLRLEDYKMIGSFDVDDFIVEDTNGTTITSLVKVDDSQVAAVRAEFKDSPNTFLIDRQQVNETFLGNLKNDFNRLIGYSLIVVLLILFLFYKRFSLTLVTSIPIFLTWFLTVGIMGLLQLEFNIFNIIICSFIFGLGVDYSIFMTNGLLTEYRTGEKTLATHKTSIMLSVITTIAAVGVMVFAKHPVLYTISLVSLIGILSAAFVSFTVQPLLFRLFIGGPDKRPISPRYLVHSVVSFGYFGLGGLLHSIYAWVTLKIDPKSNMKPNLGFHKTVSKLMGSVLYTNGFVSKKINNPHREAFEKPAMLIANHTSFLDILSIGMLHPKIIFLVNDWVYNSPIFGAAAKLAGAYPVSRGIETGEAHLRQKVAQGFSIITFPEGTRSKNNKIKRFHKGAFYLAERFDLDILPVLIHGNSEVLPKGSFIIRDGRITLEILPRITPDDNRFGNNYVERAKLIGRYFRQEFRRLRDELETPDYWQKTVLEHYRYKGDRLFNAVKNDLRANQQTYHRMLREIGPKDRILHLSDQYGQLDLLLALDAIDRKIKVYLAEPDARKMLENNFLKRQYSNLSVFDSAADVLKQPAEALLLDSTDFDIGSILAEGNIESLEHIFLLKDARYLPIQDLLKVGFVISGQSDNFMVLRRKR